jgi:hypothetical protein
MLGCPLVTLGLPTTLSSIPPPLLSSLLPYMKTTSDIPRHPPPKTHLSFSCESQPSSDQGMGLLQGTSTPSPLTTSLEGAPMGYSNNPLCCCKPWVHVSSIK